MNFDLQTIWIAGGILLIIGEMMTAGFFLLFIALGCFAAALSASLNSSYFTQGLICSIVSVLGVVLLRKPIQKRLLKGISISADIGKKILVDHPMPPHKQSRISYQGTTWFATNLDSEDIKKGDRVIIVGIDGNILLIRKLI